CTAGIATTCSTQYYRINRSSPNRLDYDNDVRLVYRDNKAGTVTALNADSSVHLIAIGLSTPEGIVVEGSGQILVAEQGRNRIVGIDPVSHVVSQWRAFGNRTGQEGIDGLGPILPGRTAQG